jgi:hypothetical protein
MLFNWTVEIDYFPIYINEPLGPCNMNQQDALFAIDLFQ